MTTLHKRLKHKNSACLSLTIVFVSLISISLVKLSKFLECQHLFDEMSHSNILYDFSV